jgi:GABA permease
VIFSYFGTEIAVMAAAESVDPAKGVRQATSTVIWRILLFFVGGVLIIATVVPWNALPDPKESAPFAYIFGLFGLPGAQAFMTAVILTAVCSVLNSGLYSAARMFAALADDGFAPGVVAKRARGVPYVAVLASTLGGYAAVAVNYVAPETGIFDFIMNSAGLVALFVYAFIALTQMRLRNAMTAEQQDALKLKMWLHPWPAILVIVAVIGVVVVMLFSEAGRVQVWTSVISLAVLIVFWPLAKRSVAKRTGHFEDIVEDLDYSGH